MSTNHLLYDSGTIVIPAGPAPFQIGPTLDVRKYAKIRVVAHDYSGPFGDIHIRFRVKEGNVVIELPPPDLVLLFGPGANTGTVVFDVPGRELEMFVRDFPAAPLTGKRLHLFVFGLEV